MATLAVMAASLQFIQYKCNAAVGHKERVGEVNAGQKLGSSDEAGGLRAQMVRRGCQGCQKEPAVAAMRRLLEVYAPATCIK